MTQALRPAPGDAAPYYFKYIELVPDGNILETLERQRETVAGVFERISDEKSLHRYDAGKWSIRDVLAHMNDTERLFAFRALWFARCHDSPLPSFDQDKCSESASADRRPWQEHVQGFGHLRASTVLFFRGLPDEAWDRRGVASDNPFTVRALAWIAAGHVIHHLKVLEERYL